MPQKSGRVGNQYKATSAIALLVFNKIFQIPFKDKSEDTFIKNMSVIHRITSQRYA